MGFFDELKDKLNLSSDDNYYDAEYDDYYEDDESGVGDVYPRPAYDSSNERRSSGVLGNPSRPEVNSVNVFTRGGQRVSSADDYSSASASMYMDDYNTEYPATYGKGLNKEPKLYSAPSYTAPVQAPDVIPMPNAFDTTPEPAAALPPYILRPVAYDDVQTVIRRVKTEQPVVLSFKKTNMDIAKRILDFCFGLSCGIDGNVEEIDDRVFVVLPHGRILTRADKDHLASQGIIAR